MSVTGELLRSMLRSVYMPVLQAISGLQMNSLTCLQKLNEAGVVEGEGERNTEGDTVSIVYGRRLNSCLMVFVRCKVQTNQPLI